MLNKLRIDYEVEDFLTDESFSNFYFQRNTKDELSWREWIADHPEKSAIVQEAKELIQTLSLTISTEEYKTELKKIKSAIDKETHKSRFHLLNWNKASIGGTKIRRTLQYAIPVTLIFVLVGYFFLYPSSEKSNGFRNIRNNENKSLAITLSDGTIVSLAPHSALQYPTTFPQNERNVHLQGEAQFHVKRKESAPFKVYSENIVATVLGAIFTFKKSGDSISVELLQGKLSVALDDKTYTGEQILLTPNGKAIYVKKAHAFYKSTITPVISRASFSFHQNNFIEIASQIKNAFGVTVINKSQNKEWRFTGVFKNTTALEVVENICVVKGLTAEIKGDTIYIK